MVYIVILLVSKCDMYTNSQQIPTFVLHLHYVKKLIFLAEAISILVQIPQETYAHCTILFYFRYIQV